MKKILLAAIAAVAMGSTAMALEVKQSGLKANREAQTPELLTKSTVHKASRAETTYTLSLTEDVSSWTGMRYAGDYCIYQYIPAEIADLLIGDKLTQIYYSVALQSTTQLSGSVFVSEDLEADPITQTSTNIKDCYSTGGYNYTYFYPVTLDEPYEIKEGQGFYIGYTVTGCDTNDYPIAVDGYDATEYAGGFRFTMGDQVYEFDMAEDVGTNLAIKATTVGHGPQDYFTITGTNYIDGLTFSVGQGVTDVNPWISVRNEGSNAITNIKYEYSINGSDFVANELNLEIPALSWYYVDLPVNGLVEGMNDIQIVVTSVNGVVQDGVYGQYHFRNLPADATTYTRKMLVEEGTGTWCGWCPRGIVGMDYMEENYPDDFIGIAVHVASSSGDKYACESYLPFVYAYFSGFPICMVNREPFYLIDPNINSLPEAYEEFATTLGVVKVEMEGFEPVDNQALVRLSTTFSFTETEANYLVAFVVLEDGLSGRQTNNYSGYGTTYPEAGDWGNKSRNVTWTYTNTARDIFEPFGMENMIPSTIEAGQVYTCEYNVDLSNVKKKANSSIVAMVLDGTTGVVLNAEKISYDDLSGINDAVLSQQGAAVVRGLKGEIAIEGAYKQAQAYTLSGQAVSLKGLTPGLYLVNVDGNTHKVIVK